MRDGWGEWGREEKNERKMKGKKNFERKKKVGNMGQKHIPGL